MTIVSKQVNMELHKIKQKCPLYESNGATVSFFSNTYHTDSLGTWGVTMVLLLLLPVIENVLI